MVLNWLFVAKIVELKEMFVNYLVSFMISLIFYPILFIAIEEQKTLPKFDAQNSKLQTILRLDCRNVEPVTFSIKKVPQC